ncbi:MAG: hypothetical protein V3V71_09530 [Roseateles sp.]|jgi:hypothetical protein|nr:hypothetical protein [Methylibium sp.]MBY0367228.1 hypothetical protein [Burkholderiaceae bacterium]|mmetsp:Transcript_23366/g.55544  ORF Transcript_23366/g.55544 Transcript_23366/m.55544 type:complete len:178 (-) Transcript_23366:1195-1728(-)
MNARQPPTGQCPPSAPADRRLWRGSSARRASQTPEEPFARQFQADLDFVAMLKGLRPSGGLMRFSELAGWLDRRQPGASRQLSQWSTRQDLCELHWRGQLWVPVCQFDPATGRLRADLSRVMRALRLNPGCVAFLLWLARPQPRYDRLTAAELLVSRPQDFERAAQADWGEPWAQAA